MGNISEKWLSRKLIFLWEKFHIDIFMGNISEEWLFLNTTHILREKEASAISHFLFRKYIFAKQG